MRILCSLLTIVISAFSLLALPREHYAAHSRLAKGHWVKVCADTTGIFQVEADSLKAWGFSEPSQVFVYGYGAAVAASNMLDRSVPDDLVATPTVYTADGRLLFFAEGEVRGNVVSQEKANFSRNYYDKGGVYFLSDQPSDPEAHAHPFTAGRDTVGYHLCLDLIEREVQNPAQGGVFYHGKPLAPGEADVFPFHIKDFGNPGSQKLRGFFRYESAVNSEVAVRMPISFSDNVRVLDTKPNPSGVNMLDTRLYVDANGEAHFTEKNTASLEDEIINVSVAVPSDFSGTYAAVDRAFVIYPRYNRLQGCGELIMNLPGKIGNANLEISGADADVAVWNITSAGAVKPCDVVVSDGVAMVSATGAGCRLVAFNPGAEHRKVRFAGTVENQDIHGSDVPDMLIVTTQKLLEAAREMADIHRECRGAKVAVYTQDEVFNEFGGGSRTPAAIRRLAKMYADREPGKLRHLLLYGPSSWDSSKEDILVSFECEDASSAREVSGCYVSDTYFGLLADNYTHSLIGSALQQLSVGRIPARDNVSARIANEKSRQKLLRASKPDAFYRILKFSDDGDSRIHFDHSEDFANAFSSNFTISRADNLLYPWTNDLAVEASRKLAKKLSLGQGFMFYCGHGTADDLTGQNIFSNTFILSHKYECLPLAMFASCDVYPYDRRGDAIADKMIFQPDGGALGVIAPCRKVYIEPNRLLSLEVASAYINAKPGETGADIFRNARNTLIAKEMDRRAGINTLCYNYCGDPALPLDVPEASVSLQHDALVDPLKATKISGDVLNAQGQKISDFNGLALIEVFDTPSSLTTLHRFNDDGAAKKVVSDENLLATFTANVDNGSFSAEVILPAPVQNKESKRITVTAVDAAGTLAAAGFSTFEINEAAEGLEGCVPPVISEFFIDPSSYITPEAVAPDITVRASILAGEAGIAVEGATIRPLVALSLDGKPVDGNLALSYANAGEATLVTSLEGLSMGPHSLTLEVPDNAGNCTEMSLNFTVGFEDSGIALQATDNGSEVIFNADGLAAAQTSIIITDANGTTVLPRTKCTLPFSWNTTDAAPGLYRAFMLYETDVRRGSTSAKEFMVLPARQGNK